MCPRNKPAIVRAGGIEALSKNLGHESENIKFHCVTAMRNLSDVPAQLVSTLAITQPHRPHNPVSCFQTDPATFFNRLSELLANPDPQITICAAGVIMNVTNKAENKLAFCQAKGIQALIEAVKRLSKQPQLVEPAVIGLRHVTNNHAKQDVAQSVLINEVNGLPHLMTALDHQMQVRFLLE